MWERFCQTKIRQKTKVTKAKINRVPPSFWTTMPSCVRWENMAPSIVPMPKSAPIQVVLGMRIRMATSNSTTPKPILPHGSRPSCSKIKTDSGAAENLKKRVCNKMTAGIILKTAFPIDFVVILLLIRLWLFCREKRVHITIGQQISML